MNEIKLVLLTHRHSDHFNPSTIKKIAFEHPLTRFGAGEWLIPELVGMGINKRNLDVMRPGKTYNYGSCVVIPFELVHNVRNMGYKLHFGDYKAIYATDTNSMSMVEAKGYDLYLVEANHETEEIDQRIKDKIKNGLYAYEVQAKKNHLSKEKCDDWLYRNLNEDSQYVYMHGHKHIGA